jgi:hypothetical protein
MQSMAKYFKKNRIFMQKNAKKQNFYSLKIIGLAEKITIICFICENISIFAVATENKIRSFRDNDQKSEMIMETDEKDKVENRVDVQNEENTENTVSAEPQVELYDPEELNLGEETTVSAEPQVELYDPEELDLGDETDSESEVSVVKNYSLLSPQSLLDELKVLVDNSPVDRIRRDVESIKNAFYKDLHEHDISEDDFPEDEEFVEEHIIIDPEEQEFKYYLDKYREKRAEFLHSAERQKEENYRQKLVIIEELKKLINEEESLTLTFQKFHELQTRWKEIAQVPQNYVKDLWDNWHYNVEKFYDYVKINKELRDLDLKRNLEAKNELIRKAETLLESPSVTEAFSQLQSYQDAWREIGPVTRDQREEIWDRFKEVSYRLSKKHQSYFEQLKVDRQHNIQMKVELCKRIERLNEKDIKTIKEWQRAYDELVAVLEEWKSIGFVPRKENTDIYARLKKARDEFFNKRRKYFKVQKYEINTNLRLKKALCAKAKVLKNSEDWKESTQILIEMQKEWKQIGAVPQKYSSSLWNEFNTACDEFFKRKAEYFAKRGDNQYVVNLKAKEALIVELENFVPSENNSIAFETLQQFRQRWNDIGFVPLKAKDKIQKRFFTLLDNKYNELKVPDAQRKVMRIKGKIETSGNNYPNKSMRFEREKLFSKIMHLENEIILLENNIGFFASSKKADSMIADVRKKINKAKMEIRELEEQVKLIDKEME